MSCVFVFAACLGQLRPAHCIASAASGVYKGQFVALCFAGSVAVIVGGVASGDGMVVAGGVIGSVCCAVEWFTSIDEVNR